MPEASLCLCLLFLRLGLTQVAFAHNLQIPESQESNGSGFLWKAFNDLGHPGVCHASLKPRTQVLGRSFVITEIWGLHGK